MNNEIKTINCTTEDKSIQLPKYAKDGDSGMDLRAWKYSLPSDLKTTLDFTEEGFTLKPLERVLVKTGIHIELPKNTEAQVRSRSGLALSSGIMVLNSPGTVDEGYRGDIGVILANVSNNDFIIKKGERIAQLVFADVKKCKLVKVEDLSSSERGNGGFGHTGKQ